MLQRRAEKNYTCDGCGKIINQGEIIKQNNSLEVYCLYCTTSNAHSSEHDRITGHKLLQSQ